MADKTECDITGTAILMRDGDGKKFWAVNDDGCRGKYNLDIDETIELNPVSFLTGTIIKILEPNNGVNNG